MKHKGKKRLEPAFLCGILCTVWFVLAVCSRRAGHAVFLFPKFPMEGYSAGNNVIDDRTIPRFTSTGFRYPDQFEGTLSRYGDFQRLYRPELSPAVPGLACTSFGDSSTEQMVPQGICLAGEYMLITAYDKGRSSNSVIYVMDGETSGERRLLTVLELPEKNHVGGIAFDGTYIWIARSTSGYVSVISYEALQTAVSLGRHSCRIEAYEQSMYVGVTASFVTYYKNRLWVGTYRTFFDGAGSLAAYVIERSGEQLSLRPETTLAIPSYVQGAQFLERGKEVLLVFAASGGRYTDSVLYLCRVVGQGTAMSIKLCHRYRFPPMVETLVTDGETMYFLFESAATCYSTRQYQKCPYPVDRICGIKNEDLFPTSGF